MMLQLILMLAFMGWAIGYELGRQKDAEDEKWADDAVAFFRSVGAS